MKIAEIFAELGIKLSGSSKTDLDGFEKQLLNIANAAKQAAAALAQLSKTSVPRGLRMAATPGSTPPNTSGTPTATVIAAHPTPGTPAAVPPVLPPSNPNGPAMPNSVLQGLKSLGMLGLKILGIATIAVALKSLISTLGRWLRASMAASVSTELFTRQTSVNRKTMKEWELAATKAGLSEGEASSAMKSFSQRWQNMRMTGEGAAPFSFLGIDPSAGPEKIFQKFRDKTKSMSNEEAVYFGTLLGFSEDFAAFLHSLKGDITRLPADQLLTDQQQQAVVGLNAAWVDFTTSMARLRDMLVADVSPALTRILDIGKHFADFFTANKSARDIVGSVTGHIASGQYLKAAADFLTIPTSAGGSVQTTNVGTVNINGVQDPDKWKSAFEQKVDRMIGGAYYQRPPSNLAPAP